MQRNDLTMSHKEFDKKSQMMRLSELDSASQGHRNAQHHHGQSEQDEKVTRT